MLRTQLYQLVMRGRLTTSVAKAKELRPMAEALVTRAKAGTPNARRLLASRVPLAAAEKLIRDIGPRFKERPGGYTRIIRLGARPSDGSRRAMIEFVS